MDELVRQRRRVLSLVALLIPQLPRPPPLDTSPSRRLPPLSSAATAAASARSPLLSPRPPASSPTRLPLLARSRLASRLKTRSRRARHHLILYASLSLSLSEYRRCGAMSKDLARRGCFREGSERHHELSRLSPRERARERRAGRRESGCTALRFGRRGYCSNKAGPKQKREAKERAGKPSCCARRRRGVSASLDRLYRLVLVAQFRSSSAPSTQGRVGAPAPSYPARRRRLERFLRGQGRGGTRERRATTCREAARE